jgi:acetoin utilization deacetylase AcuC-like enzyme
MGPMRVALVTHPSSLEHRGPPQHPERPDRVGAAVDGVMQSGLTVLPILAEPVDRAALLAVHDAAYVDAIEGFCRAGGGAIDLDTYAVPGSWEAALNAAGSGPTAVLALRRGDADVGFAAMRPPGHHAERSRAMGFCLFNNVAVAAADLAAAGERVAIVDWDVHHGNGTQNAFWESPRVLYVSVHQHPWYPGTGLAREVGEGDGLGTTINIPLPAGSGRDRYAEAFTRVVAPVVSQFGADWLLVSAGYDAHVRDPLAGMELDDGDYSMLSAALAPLVPTSRTVFFLEGGYDLDAVRNSVAATLDGHAGGRSSPLGAVQRPIPPPDQVIAQIVETLAPYWDVG